MDSGERTVFGAKRKMKRAALDERCLRIEWVVYCILRTYIRRYITRNTDQGIPLFQKLALRASGKVFVLFRASVYRNIFANHTVR